MNEFTPELINDINEFIDECANAFDELHATYSYSFNDDDKKIIIDELIARLIK